MLKGNKCSNNALIACVPAARALTVFLLLSPRTPECCSTYVWWEDRRFTATCRLRTGGHSTILLSTGEYTNYHVNRGHTHTYTHWWSVWTHPNKSCNQLLSWMCWQIIHAHHTLVLVLFSLPHCFGWATYRPIKVFLFNWRATDRNTWEHVSKSAVRHMLLPYGGAFVQMWTGRAFSPEWPLPFWLTGCLDTTFSYY